MDLEQLKKIAGIVSTSAPTQRDPSILSESMRKIAGLPLVESYSDEDEDELITETEKKKPSAGGMAAALKIAQKGMEQAKKEKEESSSKKDDEKGDKGEDKKPSKPKAPKQEDLFADEKKEAEGPKKRGKAHNPESKSGVLRTWIENHPGVTRGEAWKHAVEVFGEKSEDNPGGITKAGFSTLYQNARTHHGLVKKKDVKEAWLIMHPSVDGYVLHENRELNQFQWVSFLSENQDPMIFESQDEVNEVAKYLRDFKNQAVIVTHVDLENDI